MSAEYYGVGPEACAAIEKLLNLPPPFSEQNWEFCQADPARVDEMLELIERRNFDLDLRSALAQLLVASIDQAETDEVLTVAQQKRAAAYFATDPEVRNRMVFFWLEKGQSRSPHAVAPVLGIDPALYPQDEDE